MGDLKEKNLEVNEIPIDSAVDSVVDSRNLNMENDLNIGNISIPNVRNNIHNNSELNEKLNENKIPSHEKSYEEIVNLERDVEQCPLINEKMENSFDNNQIENDETNLLNSNKKNIRKVAILDSDSESEIEENMEKNECDNKTIQKSKRIAVIDSDSDDEVQNIGSSDQNSLKNNTSENSMEKTNKKKQKLKRIAVIDSDSENETDSISNDTGNLVQEPALIVELDHFKKSQKRILSNLCDSESSEEEDNKHSDTEEEVEEKISDSELEAMKNNEIAPRKSRKESQKKVRENQKQEKMTTKKALEQRKEIMAESQRRVRESTVSLPYHKPKPRTLKEFLQNRPKLASPLLNVAKGTSPSAALKMSMEQLEVVSKKIKEREKEVEEFYKSDSESENEKEELQNEEISKPDKNISDLDDNDIQKNNIEISLENQIVKNPEQTDIENDIDKKSGLIEDRSEVEIVREKEEEILLAKTRIPSFISPEGISADISNNIQQNIEKNTKNVTENSEMIILTEDEQKENISHEAISNSSNYMGEKSIQLSEKDEQIKEDNSPEKESSENNTSEKKEIVDDTQKLVDEEKSKGVSKLNIISDIVIVKPSGSGKSDNLYCLGDDFEDENNEDFNIESYDFNLDDIEDESENIEKKQSDFRKNMRELLEKSLGTGVLQNNPRLSGGPNLLIDLENGVMVDDEISKLRERFQKHNAKINKHKHKKEISIVSVNDGTVRKETVAVDVDEDDEEDTAPIEKPGVRFQKLREQLQNRMSERRSGLWKKKTDETAVGDEHSSSENDESKLEKDVDALLDNDEEEELTESEEEDEELEEDDCDMTDKKRKPSSFVDNEAVESDVEENDDDDDIELNEDDNELEDDEDEENDVDVDAEDEAAESETEEKSPKKKKVLKRIIKPFDNDDSDDDDDDDDRYPQNQSKFVLAYQKKTKGCSSDDDSILLHQPTNYKTREPGDAMNKSELDFSTPVTYMTGLKNLNTSGIKTSNISTDKFNESSFIQKELLKDGVGQIFDNLPSTQDIMESIDKYEHMHEKDSVSFVQPTVSQKSELISTQDVLAICSGNFPGTNSSQSELMSTQDVLAVCSGNFPTSAKSISSPEITMQSLKEIFTESNSDFNTQDLGDICSGKFTGASSSTQKFLDEKEAVLDKNEESLISQLIDEEEMARFKKKFESPLPTNTQKTINLDEVEEVKGTGGLIDSDEDDESKLTLKKRKRKRLAFSDDEESFDGENEPEETIDLADDFDDEEEKNVEYDSEENEIDFESRTALTEERKKERIKASEFLEKEAELSESEWGSEDEDEKNLDDMEFEKGDEEKFDDDELRSDIEKLQMKQMLDEDNREVKLLQELLLEDGELHGSGRERQFRWKNIDEAGNELDESKVEDDDIYLDEDNENEEKWRKMRHEREMFMMKKQSQEEEDDDCLVMESRTLSFTKRTLKIKSQTTLTISQNVSEAVSESPKAKQPFTLLNKRGSFLTRSEQMLKKIAESSHQVSLGSKNANRIVFQAKEEVDKKRKSASLAEADSTPVALKKIRLTELSPALMKKKPKISKSLFSNISID